MSKLRVVNGKFHVNIYRGDTEDILIDRIRDSDGNTIDLSTLYSDVKWQVKKYFDSADSLLDKELGSGIEFVNDSDGNSGAAIQILLPASDTEKLPPGELIADLEFTLTDGSKDTVETENGNRKWIVNVTGDVTI